MNHLIYRGWSLKVYRQVHIPPFHPYCAEAEKKIGNVIHLINAEGRTEEEAVENLKKILDKK